MKAYKVTKTYCYQLSAIVYANDEDEAMDSFDLVPEHDCKEEYLGALEAISPDEYTIEEVPVV